MTNLQGTRLAELVGEAYHDVEYYREKMQTVGLEPGDIKGVEDLGKLSFTTKDDLRDAYPFGMLAVSNLQITRICVSSNTMGEAIVVGYTHKDIDVWSEYIARCITVAGLGRDDTAQVAYGHGLFISGLGVHYGAGRIGAIAASMSTGNAKKSVTMMVDFGVAGITCTPLYSPHIAEIIKEVGVRNQIKLKASINGAEPWTDKTRAQIERQLGIHAHDIYGLNETVGPGVVMDYRYHTRFHIHEDHLLPEIVDQHTLKPLRDGMEDKLVISMLTKEGLPLIRYCIKDLISPEHGPCEYGRTTARIVWFTGRMDNIPITRSINVFPSQIESALLEMRGIIPYCLFIVDRINNLDALEVQTEVEERFLSDEIRELENLTGKITHVTQETIGLAVKMKLVEPKGIKRSMDKIKHIVDGRTPT